ncbi:MAG TPA: DUF4190 domain-containing protein [Tepidisphaeraceae bacterium]|jgi:hypothetical protein
MTSIEQPAERTNRPALLAMIAGLLSFIPFVGLVALTLGVIGLARVRRDGGRGNATFGIVLGILGLFWTAMLAGAVAQYMQLRHAEPAINTSAQFIMLVGSGNVGAAKGLCMPEISETRLTDTVEKFEQWGVIQDVDKYYGGEVHNRDNIEVQALIRFDKSAQIFIGYWTRVEGNLRLRDYKFEDAPASATQPPE